MTMRSLLVSCFVISLGSVVHGTFAGHDASAGTIQVPADESTITAALATAQPGDVIAVAAGTYDAGSGESFPLLVDRDVSVLGAGMGETIVDAGGAGSVFILETAIGGRLSGMTITGGEAARGGGVHVAMGTPEIDDTLILANGALNAGSGIYATGFSAPWIHHNVVWQSFDLDFDDPGDPHGIQLLDSDALVEHNLIGRTDSNGLLVHAGSNPVIRNNIFFENGIEGVRGRGVCAFGGPGMVIAHNLFHGNAIAAILFPGATGDVSGEAANDVDPEDLVYGNLDGDPLFVDAESDWRLTADSPAIDAGDPTSPDDPDATPADIGPFFYDQSIVSAPDVSSLPGALLPAAPNPFRQSTTIELVLDSAAHVRVNVFDTTGRLVARVFDGPRSAGTSAVSWDGRLAHGGGAPAGIYFVRVEAGAQSGVQKLVRR